ncbi:hypothetical protein V8F33_011140 [Rhypophila sp. PSN 637]
MIIAALHAKRGIKIATFTITRLVLTASKDTLVPCHNISLRPQMTPSKARQTAHNLIAFNTMISAETFKRPIDALGALPARNNGERESEATHTWSHYLEYKTAFQTCYPHRSWHDRPLGDFVMQVYAMEDLWEDIKDQVRSTLLVLYGEELEALGAELIARRETQHGDSRWTSEMDWIEQGLRLIGNPPLTFNPDYLRDVCPFYTGNTVGELKNCVIRRMLRDCGVDIRSHFFQTLPRLRSSVEAKRLSSMIRIFR